MRHQLLGDALRLLRNAGYDAAEIGSSRKSLHYIYVCDKNNKVVDRIPIKLHRVEAERIETLINRNQN